MGEFGPKQQERLIARSREVFDRVFMAEDSPYGGILPRASCLYHAAALIFTAHQSESAGNAGIQIQPQAGTAFFRRTPPHMDDLEQHSAFGYEWQGLDSPETIAACEAGIMPEMHVWCACAVNGILIDTTTKYIVEQCRIQGGMGWRMPKPPDFIWATRSEMPDGYVYLPQISAMRFIARDLLVAVEYCARVMGNVRLE